MALEEPQEGDIVLERSGVRIAVAGSFRLYFDNTILDYEDSAFSRGFMLRPGKGPSSPSGGAGEVPSQQHDDGVPSSKAEVSSQPAVAGAPADPGDAAPRWRDGRFRDGRSVVRGLFGATATR